MGYRAGRGRRAKCEWFARCTKIRRNASKRRVRGFRWPAYTYAYPHTRKPRGGPIRAVSEHSRIHRKPRFPVRHRNPHGLPRSGCARLNPGPCLDRAGGAPKRKNPARGGVRFQHHLSDYAGCIVLNASGIFRLSRSINRRVRSTNLLRARHRPCRVPP